MEQDFDTEKIIIYHLLKQNSYFNTVFGSLKPSHFNSLNAGTIFTKIKEYFEKYEKSPSFRELGLFIHDDSNIDYDVKKNVLGYMKSELMNLEPLSNYEYLLDYTKNALLKSSLTDAIMDSVKIIQSSGNFNEILSNIENALAYDFDKKLGSEFKDSAKERHEIYKQKFNSTSTGIVALDNILGGGLRPKTLTVLAGFSHSGKSSIKASIQCGMAKAKANTLFVTLEMPETDVLKKIDSNLMDIDSNLLEDMPEDQFIANVNKISPNIGKMFVKEYSAGEMDVLKLKNLIDDLEKENDCTIDAIFIDYLGLMKSARVSPSVGLYGYYKSIAEELHGFAKKFNKIMVTSAQLNRNSAGNLDAGMETVSDSIGVVQTADIFINILTNDELKANSQTLLKFEKNRYTGKLDKLLCEANWAKAKIQALDENANIPEIKSNFADVQGMEEAVGFSYSDVGASFDEVEDLFDKGSPIVNDEVKTTNEEVSIQASEPLMVSSSSDKWDDEFGF